MSREGTLGSLYARYGVRYTKRVVCVGVVIYHFSLFVFTPRASPPTRVAPRVRGRLYCAVSRGCVRRPGGESGLSHITFLGRQARAGGHVFLSAVFGVWAITYHNFWCGLIFPARGGHVFITPFGLWAITSHNLTFLSLQKTDGGHVFTTLLGVVGWSHITFSIFAAWDGWRTRCSLVRPFSGVSVCHISQSQKPMSLLREDTL